MSLLHCPHCGAELAGHDHIGPSHIVPEPGAVSVCSGCHEPAVFATGPDGQLHLRTPTTQEYALIHAHPTMQATRQALRGHASSIDAVGAARLAVRRDAD